MAQALLLIKHGVHNQLEGACEPEDRTRQSGSKVVGCEASLARTIGRRIHVHARARLLLARLRHLQ
jgi:hypothetical protein